MEELFGFVFRLIVQGVVWLLVECLFWGICYYTGWVVCKVCTLGKYPTQPLSLKGMVNSYPSARNRLSLIGLMFLVLLIVVLLVLN